MAALRKVRANPERSASQSACRTNEQLKTFTGVTGFGERRARHAKLDAITARLLEVDRQTRVAGVTPSVAAEEGSESPGASSIRRRLTPRVCAGILNPPADFS